MAKITIAMVLSLLAACGGDDDVPLDAGRLDSGLADSGSTDSGSMDSGSMDSGSMDGGSEDGGSMDGGSEDGGSSDSGADGGGVDGGFVCTANVLANGSFDSDVSSWEVAFPSVNTVDHDASMDVSGSASSGSLRSRSTRAVMQRDPVTQCVAVAAGAVVRVQAQAFLAASAVEEGEVQVTLNFYSMADCGGAFLTTQHSPPQSMQGDWLTLDVGGTAPATAVSMRVMLDVIRTAGTELTTHWDDVCAMAL